MWIFEAMVQVAQIDCVAQMTKYDSAAFDAAISPFVEDEFKEFSDADFLEFCAGLSVGLVADLTWLRDNNARYTKSKTIIDGMFRKWYAGTAVNNASPGDNVYAYK